MSFKPRKQVSLDVINAMGQGYAMPKRLPAGWDTRLMDTQSHLPPLSKADLEDINRISGMLSEYERLLDDGDRYADTVDNLIKSLNHTYTVLNGTESSGDPWRVISTALERNERVAIHLAMASLWPKGT